MSANKPMWASTQGIAAIGIIGAVSYFLFMEHQEHLLELIPYLIFLLCPLMHLFMHKGHAHSHNHENQQDFGHDNKVPGTATRAYEKGIEEGIRRAKIELKESEKGG